MVLYWLFCSYSSHTLSQRSQLFPSEDRYNDGSRSPTPSQRAAQGYNSSSNRFDSGVLDTLEGQNDDMIEGLSQKVKILKDVPLPFPPASLLAVSRAEERLATEKLVEKHKSWCVQVTVKIGSEIRDSSNLMDTMNDTFANTRVYLGGTVRRMQRMAERQGVGWFMFMMFLFVVFLIFLLVWLFR